MHSQRRFLISHCAFFIIASGAASAQMAPTVEKSFLPNPITDGNAGFLTITLTNPNSDGLAIDASVKDVLPGCLTLAVAEETDVTFTSGCYADFDRGDVLAVPSMPQTVSIRGSLGPKASCTLSVKVVPLTLPCDNTTDAPVAGNLVGIPGSATWTANSVTTATYTASVSGGQWSNALNFGGTAVANGNSMVFPAVNQNKTTTDDVAALTVPKISVTDGGYGFSASSPSIALTVGELNFNTPAGGTVSWNIPLNQTQDFVVNAVSGEPFFVAPINNNSNNVYVFGGRVSLSHITGTANLGIDVTDTVIMTSSPAFTGNIDVVGGNFKPFTAISQSISVHGHGRLNQVGGPDAMVTVFGHGSTQALGSLPGTSSFVQLAYNNGFHVVDVAPTAYSQVTVSGSLTFNNTALLLNVSTLPSPGTTYNDIFSTTGTISGCPAETFCSMEGCEGHAVCTDTTVSVVVDSNNGIFKSGMDAASPFCTSCVIQTCDAITNFCTN